jgi:7-carboxy-7-deazaguanine synthase
MMNLLPVMEHFYTIQGEGFYSGRAAYFVRLGGCDVGCTWCDVKESWNKDAHPKYTVEEIVSWIVDANASLCVITGGEPLMHDLSLLTAALKAKNIQVNIETSGTSPISGTLDFITFSPKRFKKPLAEFYDKAGELKVIIAHNNDIRWAEEHADKINKDCILYLQPEWSNEKEMLNLIIPYVKENPKWRISLQTHKYMNID